MYDKFMNIAIIEAKKAFFADDVPVGTVIVKDSKIIAKAHNSKNKTNNAFDHAEIIAIRRAARKLNDWRLIDCEMYTTLEPCPMCAGAILNSRIKKVYAGSKSNNDENSIIIKSIFNNKNYCHRVEYNLIDDKRCSGLLKEFFASKR